MNKLGYLTNDIRELFKTTDKDDFIEKLLAIMNVISSMYESIVLIHKDSKSAMNSFFSGYLSISLMLMATDSAEISNEKKLLYIETVIRIIEGSLMENMKEAVDGQRTQENQE